MTLHIVHPHTYFLVGDALTDVLSAELQRRNAYAGRFITEWPGERLCHWQGREHQVEELMEQYLLSRDRSLRGVLNLPSVKTTPSGMPVPEKAPEGIREDVYERVKDLFSTEERFCGAAGSGPHVVIGGALEFCVANAAHYLHTRLGEAYVVPEVSMVHDPSNLAAFLERLDGLGIRALTAQEARDLL